MTGSSGFGTEVVDGVARHAMDHYLDACASGLDLACARDPRRAPSRLAPASARRARDAATSRVLKAAFAPNRSL